MSAALNELKTRRIVSGNALKSLIFKGDSTRWALAAGRNAGRKSACGMASHAAKGDAVK
jgi:hypothetical protein